MTNLYASIEAGGTKFVCAVGNDKLEILVKTSIPTTSPDETLVKVKEFFQDYLSDISAMSVASFGPIDLITDSSTYGYITTTPKEKWRNYNLIGQLKEFITCPIYFTTDVNASAYGEALVHSDKNHLVYFTIGTGIGAGIINNGLELSGIGHPEFGHIPVKKHPDDINFSGVCPFHGDCLEGLASGPSLFARTRTKGEDLPLDHKVWDIQAYYIAQAVVTATLTIRPDLVVLGGGVMAQAHMLDRVRTYFTQLINDYVSTPLLDEYIVKPMIENNGSATIGNFALAKALVMQN